MAIQQTLTTSFKLGMVQAEQDLATDTLYIALYTAFSDIGPNTTEYTTTNEIVGTGYTAGGQELTGVTIGSNTNGVIYINFDNVVWTPAAFTCRGALIYNVTKANKSVAVLDFGSDKTSTNTFTITMPVNTATTALLRFT
tara:strand:+ start:410 stop:829 length:420 start_codon:yes stop_codon:yes gene_type:complete